MSKAYFITKSGVFVEMPGIEPRTFHMQSERSTTELHPLGSIKTNIKII